MNDALYAEIDLRELLAVLTRGRRFIAAVTLIALLMGAAYAFFLYVPTYQASTLVDLSFYWSEPGCNESTAFAGKGSTKTFLDQCLARSEQENIPAEALARLDFIDIKGTSLVEVRASYHDPVLAAGASRLAGEELLALARRQKIEALEQQIRVANLSLQRLEQEIKDHCPLNSSFPPLQDHLPAEDEPCLHLLLEAHSDLLYELSLAGGRQEQLIGNPAPVSSPWISEGALISPRVAVYRLVYVLASLLLGLLISCLAVFTKSYCCHSDTMK